MGLKQFYDLLLVALHCDQVSGTVFRAMLCDLLCAQLFKTSCVLIMDTSLLLSADLTVSMLSCSVESVLWDFL